VFSYRVSLVSVDHRFS